MWLEKFESNINLEKKENKNTNHLENAIKELWKLVWQEEINKLTKELGQIDKFKNKEISEAIKPHKIGLTFYHKETTLSIELPQNLDYSNLEHLKKATQIALLRKARENLELRA